MKADKSTGKMIRYELRNLVGNPFVHIFGVVFPIFMTITLSAAIGTQESESVRREINTQLVITMSMVIPMALVLIGYAANYSQEVEKGIPLRMALFGLSAKRMIAAKIYAQLIFMTLVLAFYSLAEPLLLPIKKPRLGSLAILAVCLYLLAVCFFALSHGLSQLFRKFGPTYCVTMLLYFMFMLVGGMLGVQRDQMPPFLEKVARLLPMSYISADFGSFWAGGSYNFAPLIQSFLFLFAVSGMILLASAVKRKRA